VALRPEALDLVERGFAPAGSNSMPFLFKTAPGANSMSPRLRQLTATQGLEGTKWKFSPRFTSVTRCSLASAARSS
jgi:hypothetical protein